MRHGTVLQPMSVQRTHKARFKVIVHDPITVEKTGARGADIDHAQSELSPEENSPDSVAGRLRWSDPRLRAWLAVGMLGGQAQSILLGVIGGIIYLAKEGF